ncbi:hypothetical protein GYB29_09370 [bacterium]|nr:hypothetical protein [bacterium]
MKNPAELIKKIEQTGFLTNTENILPEQVQEILKHQSSGGFPIKTWFAIVVIVVWNFLLMYDFMIEKEGQPSIGVGVKSALTFVFVTSLLLLISEPFRKLVLNEGRTLQDIKKFVLLLMVIAAIMLIQLNFF